MLRKYYLTSRLLQEQTRVVATREIKQSPGPATTTWKTDKAKVVSTYFRLFAYLTLHQVPNPHLPH
jgi:hypothetical protein